MEKIQAAIAKARREREQQASEAPTSRADMRHPDTGAHLPERGAEPSPPGTAGSNFAVPAISPDIVAAWQELDVYMPPAKRMARRRIVSFEGGPDSSASDILRTKVLQQMRANNWRRLAVTSPSTGCGKSTTVMNLAFSLSRQADLRTIVCDMDMRHSSLGQILGLNRQRSFARVLTGESDFRAEAVRVRTNLAFGVNETRVRNSAELLQGPLVGPALAKLSQDYAPDVMIFDLPAMSGNDDAMAFLGKVDCVLIVAAAGKTSVSDVDRCEAELAQQTNVLGVVLNKCRYMDESYA